MLADEVVGISDTDKILFHCTESYTFSHTNGWNCLPPELRDAPTLAVFKAGIRSINLGDVINKAHYQK